MRLLATVSCVLMLLAAPAFGQAGNPAGMILGTGPQQPNSPDRLFVRAAAIGGMAEVEFGELAQEKAQDDAVREFGRRMVEDHGKANDRLISIAKSAGIAVPDALDPEHQAMRDRLSSLDGAEFDLVYVSGQVADHQKAVAAFGVRDRLWAACRSQELRLRDSADRAAASSGCAGLQAEITGKSS